MEDRRALLVVALATLLFFTALRSFFSSVYFLNLETLELNETAAYTLLLLSPLLLAWGPLARRPRPLLVTATGILAVGGILTGLAKSAGMMIALAGLTSAAYLILLPLLIHLARPMIVTLGITSALAFDVARMLLGNGAQPMTPGLQLAFQAILGVVLFGLLLLPRGTQAAEQTDGISPRAALPAGLGVGAWLFLQTNIWGSAHHVARWNEVPVLLAAAGAIIGLTLGAVLVLRIAVRPPGPKALVLAQLYPLILLVDHTLIHSPVLPLTLLLAQSVLVIDLALLLQLFARARLPAAALGLGAGMALFLALVFTTAFAFTFAYVPYGALWEGRAGLFLLVAVAAVLAAGMWALTQNPSQPPPMRSRTPGDRRIVAALLVVPLVIGAIGAVVPDAPATAPTDRHLRVLSYNVHQGFNNDGVLEADRFVRIVEALDPDLVSLQETDTSRITSGNLDIVDALASRLGYHAYHGPPTRAQSFGVAILSRYPIENTHLQELSSSTDNRYLVGAQVTIDGTPTWFLAVHMGLPQNDRQAQIDEILTRAERLGGPRILAGDFNSCPQGLCPDNEDPPDTVYTQITSKHQDTWTAAGHDRDDPTGNTYTAAAPDRRIDHIYVTHGFTVTESWVDRSSDALAASDHLPVLAELTLNE